MKSNFEDLEQKFNDLQKENSESLKILQDEVQEKHDLKDKLEKVQNELSKMYLEKNAVEQQLIKNSISL